MSTVRTVKKYPNRRLYDPLESRYVTLTDIRRLVQDKIDFVVVDRKTNEDITNSVLLQVVAEEERGDAPLLDRGLLLKLVQAYSSPARNSISSHLEQSLAALLASKDRRAAHDEKRDSNGLSAQSGADRNFEQWGALQNEMYRARANGTGGLAERPHEEVAGEAAVES